MSYSLEGVFCLFVMGYMAAEKVSTMSKSISYCEQVSKSPGIEDSREVKGVALKEALPPDIGQ